MGMVSRKRDSEKVKEKGDTMKKTFWKILAVCPLVVLCACVKSLELAAHVSKWMYKQFHAGACKVADVMNEIMEEVGL